MMIDQQHVVVSSWSSLQAYNKCELSINEYCKCMYTGARRVAFIKFYNFDDNCVEFGF